MAASLFFSWPAPSLAAEELLVTEATRQLSAGTMTPPADEFKLIDVSELEASSPWDILAPYTARFGPLIAGSKIFLRVRIVDQTTGLEGVPIVGSVIVT